jgi:hypothetical protein
MKRFMALILRVGSAFWQQREPLRKLYRSEDPNDYPGKPFWLGYEAAIQKKTFKNNPYLDYPSIKDWDNGYRYCIALTRYEKTRQQRFK